MLVVLCHFISTWKVSLSAGCEKIILCYVLGKKGVVVVNNNPPKIYVDLEE